MKIQKELLLKNALMNAVSYKGKANAGAVLGKVLQEHPELKESVDEIKKEVNKIVEEVNRMSVDDQQKKLKDIFPEYKEKKKDQKKELPELKNAVMGNVITRLPPEPSKYLHLGHAISFIINYLYAKKYDGKCFLRFEDTNPAKAKKEYINSIKQEITEILQIKPDQTIIVSNDMEKFYGHAEKLIEIEKAYVCTCSKERIRDLRHKGDLCGCRTKTKEQNMQEWKQMLAGKYKEESAVLRLVGDMENLNHVMRDPLLFRITHEEHYLHKKKYCVWPLYDFENAIEDSTEGITHILRSNEFGEMRIELQDYIKSLLKLPKQTVVQYGRFNVIGSTTKGREIRDMIKEKKYIGWDDPRLVTLYALTKRCIMPETYRSLALEAGLSASVTNLDFSVISSINRKVLDPQAKRFFLVSEPKEITIDGAPEQEAEIKNHPTEKSLGVRKYKVSGKFIIEKKDFDEMKDGKTYRLMDCINFTKKGGKMIFHSLSYEEFKDKGEKIIQWLPPQHKKAHIMMPDAKKATVLVEEEATKLPDGEIIQFVRFGFCRVESKKDLLFWYGHE